MARTVYALLVAIDDYPEPIPPLSGCVADLEAMQAYLEGRIGADGHRLEAMTLKNAEATRAAVIEAFQQHLGQAGPGDTALFCYSGHGSQCPTAPEFYHLEPDRLDETLVCYDSRMPDNFDLADKEMSKLIADVAKSDAHVVLMLDSCHSGSATRSLESTNVRRVATDNRQRPASSYLVSPEELGGMAHSRGVNDTDSGWIKLPQGRHIVLSACQSEEEAKEDVFDGAPHGVFSHYLLDTLQNANSDWTYRDLFSRVSSMVRTTVSRQSPVIEATDFGDLDRPFLGGAIRPHPDYFTLTFDDIADWTIDGGTIHGIPAVQADDTTELALFPIEATDLDDPAQAIGTARVLKRETVRSQVAITLNDGSEPDFDTTYKAVITAQPVAALGVRLDGDEAALQRVRDAMSAGAGAAVPLQEVDSGEELCLTAADNAYQVSRAADERPLFVPIKGWTDDSAGQAVAHCEHIGRWMRMAKLRNTASKLPANAITIDFYEVADDGSENKVDPAGSGGALRLSYEFRDNQWHSPRFRLKLTNNSQRRLYCMLFDMTDSFAIFPELLPGGGEWLEPGQEVWALRREELEATVPDDLWREGMTEFKDLIKVVASTEQCDATRFRQEDLGIRFESPRTRSLGMNSLEKLMHRSMTRHIGGSSGAGEKVADWTTAELTVTTERPLEAAAVPDTGASARIAPKVTLHGHAGLRANVRLDTVPVASRDLSGAPPLPVWLRDDPGCVRPFDLSPSRGVEGGLSVLELADVSDHESVTPEQPLKLSLGTPLNPGEHLLAVAYDADGDFYLPLGRAAHEDGALQVSIERLPAPVSSRRSLTGSIKIFFQKVISEKLGQDFEYPLLRAAEAADGGIRYVSGSEEVRSRVRDASRILLYVHGIIGDTEGMAKSALHPGAGQSSGPSGKDYDLVLTFDYENLNTEIEANARALKERLDQAGLGPDHGKTLHVVAHSMGGLVSRWFIEHLDGHRSVQRLVMLGTPNGGSPWPSVEEWATAAIGVGLNKLGALFWPAGVLGSLMAKFEEAAGASLNQMNPGSPLLENLAASPDPGVPYRIVAGNTSLAPDALETEGPENQSRLHRLFEKLNLQRVIHATASLAFFSEPNDIAASVSSIGAVPETFGQADPVREVACDHLTYFSTDEGMAALKDSLD
jgi:pimeloyl-ACP methyl ester carboxylesterase